jgi:hypothetical protein
MVVLAMALSTAVVESDSPTPKPFHLQFKSYEKNRADGSYVFHILFSDLPFPHINWHSFSHVRSFKIGDTIGAYKITGFDVKFHDPDPKNGLDDSIHFDTSLLTLQSITKPDEKVSVIRGTEYDLPRAFFRDP